MNCKNCGCALHADADICYSCGTPVESPAKAHETYALDDSAPQIPAQEEAVSAAAVDNARKAGLFVRIVSFLFAVVGLILFGVQKKNGEEAQAVSIADSIMAGICAKLAVVLCYLVIGLAIHR